jgi:hypothetical protein
LAARSKSFCWTDSWSRVPCWPIKSRASIAMSGASSSPERCRTASSRMCRLVLVHCLVWTDQPGSELPDRHYHINFRQHLLLEY